MGRVLASLTILGLQTFLLQNPDVRRIDDLLPALPQAYRRNFTLMYRSRSRQGASPSAPRAILYGEDAKLILAFNGDPGQLNYRTLEAIEFHPQTATFEFREFQFPEKEAGGKVEVSEPNPKRCLDCHGGADPRPNWEHYDNWPGAFAEQDDRLELQPEMVDFLSLARNLDRYRYLPWLKESYQQAQYGRRTSVEHNILLNQRAAALNFQRVTRLLKANPQYARYKYAALGAMWCVGSLPDFFPPALRVKLQPALDAMAKQPLGNHNFIPLFEALGSDAKAWSMDFESEAPSFAAPYSDRLTLSGFLAAADSDLQRYVLADPFEYHGAQIYDAHFIGDCVELGERSRQALSQ